MTDELAGLPEADAEAFEPQNYNRAFAGGVGEKVVSPLHASM